MAKELHYQAPQNAEEFWVRDGGYVQNLVRKMLGPGTSAHDAEDVAADIFERLLVARNLDGQGILEQYSAGFTSERTGQPVTWRGFLSGKVSLYVRGKREKLARDHGRELLLCDTQAGDGGERWVELFGGQVWDDYPSLTDEQFTERMRDYLATVPDGWDGGGSLFQVFNEILERVKNGERVTQVAGMSRKDTAAAVSRIRQAVEGADWSHPQWGDIVVGGIALTPTEARDALDRLRAAKGNHVHRALAGHRLTAEAPKGWYHEFAQAELQCFPECDVDSREGRVGGGGAGHVKEAVIHGLARMLAGAPEPEPVPAAEDAPEEEVTREDLLESELWHIQGMGREMVDAVISAARKVYAQ
jgi:hypothetical protein